ncbi:hypothetical protein I4U23_009531 [Adineta vaga]|nr:hypothetical protein I4U23_009531 [Adineta vaga]
MKERFVCSRMLKALNEKQYKLFREHLNGYASLFTLIAPTMNNDKRIGHTAYTILQQDLERLAKTEMYEKLLKGFQPMCEGLPMRIQFDDQFTSNSLLPNHVRIILVSSTNQYYLPIKSNIHIDEKTNTVHFDASLKSNLLATGHFALEFDSNQSSFKFLSSYVQEINRLTNINCFPSKSETCNYLSTILCKSKSILPYQWYISHDQTALSIHQIPFTSVKQLLHILNLIAQQMYLTKYLDYYFNNDYDHDHMDDDNQDISLELSFLSSSILSITCAQSYHLATFLLQMSNKMNLPLLICRQQEKEIPLTEDRQALMKLIPQLLKEDNINPYTSATNVNDLKPTSKFPEQLNQSNSVPKFNRRLSCGPPAKPVWRRATTLRRNQPVCLTLTSVDNISEKLNDEQLLADDQSNRDISSGDFQEDNDPFIESPEQQTIQHHYHQPLLPKPSLSFHPSVLSRCGSVSSTQSVSTPPIPGLSPSTPYPGGSNNPNGNIFFPLGKQVSVPDYNPVSPSITFIPLDSLVFLPTSGSTSSSLMPPTEPNNKAAHKKKRRRSEQSNEDFIQTSNNNPNDNRSPMHATKLMTTSNDSNSAKRGKKPADKTAQQQQQFARQKSAFKLTDVPSTTLHSQQSITSPDDTSNELKPLKVVIKRVNDGGNSSNDESQQQQSMKQRKNKQLQHQQSMGNLSGSMSSTIRKLPTSNSSGGSSPSVLIKSESLDMSQMNSDPNSMMSLTDGIQQSPRERPRPSSSLSNPSSTLPTSTSLQPRSVPPQPPIVLKIQRSKVYSGQEQSSSTTSTTGSATTATTATPNSISTAVKEVLKHRARSMPTGANTNKPHVTSPPLLASKLSSPSSTGTINNSLAAPTPIVPPLFRIPRKSSSQEVTAKIKTEPGTINNNSSPVLSKTPLLPTPGVRPPPPSQIGSWQSPPTQQPSRFHQTRPRSSWSQQQPPRGRTTVTPPNVTALTNSHTPLPNFSQQPRSILKKPPSNENSSSDLLYMPSSDLPGLNEQRSGMNFPGSSSTSRTTTPPGMYDDNDDDSSPQAQLVIDTGSQATNNVLLPYTIVPGSSSSGIDNFDSTHENNTNQQQQQQLGDESLSNLD